MHLTVLKVDLYLRVLQKGMSYVKSKSMAAVTPVQECASYDVSPVLLWSSCGRHYFDRSYPDDLATEDDTFGVAGGVVHGRLRHPILKPMQYDVNKG